MESDARRLERLRVDIFAQPDDLARAVASRIATLIRERAAAGCPCVLGLATGSTPVGVYHELVRMHREEGLSFRGVTTFNLDEYWPMSPDSIHSYHRFMREQLFDLVDLDPARTHLPPGEIPREQAADACAAYEAAIRAAGGIDLQLLGIGKTGHIGFNEPGSGAESRTRLITLDTLTRRDAAADFFGAQNVPREAITMGVASILEAREICLLATGEHKATILRRAIEGDIDHQVAATFLQRHPGVTVYCDNAAAADLTRVATPWLVDEVHWTTELAIRAVTWLSRTVGRAMLKLTETDYVEHHLGSLLALYGAPGVVNGLVFNALGAKIRGRSKLPRKQKVICFSPHPDDDVISAGGILRKLTLNENHIVVAYMTSGNIAVFDHDVLRYVDVLERLAADAHLGRRNVDTLAARVRKFLAEKAPGEVDIQEVLDLKRIIREAEAVSGIETIGLHRENARFLNLPFYRTGKVKKDPVGPADIAVVRALLEEERPDLLLVAGDLSDPHGTHRLCKDAIDLALAELYPDGAGRPDVWLYRGAWQEWPITEATWLVPLAQEELHLKIQAIFKHQTQKDSAPFPGADEREFWQRVESRNKETAAIVDRLGLAEYFAMEAYVVA
ncbi:MAG: glucosamine-6-phosphate deaminase [Gemmatimonadales bacterium]